MGYNGLFSQNLNNDFTNSIHVSCPTIKGLRHHTLGLLILIPQRLKFWEYKNMIQHPALFSILMIQSQESHNRGYGKIKVLKLKLKKILPL